MAVKYVMGRLYKHLSGALAAISHCKHLLVLTFDI